MTRTLVSKIRLSSTLVLSLALASLLFAGSTTWYIAEKRADLTGRSIELLLLLDNIGGLFPRYASIVSVPFDPSRQDAADWLGTLAQLNAELEADREKLHASSTRAKIDLSPERLASLNLDIDVLRAPVTALEQTYRDAVEAHHETLQTVERLRVNLQDSAYQLDLHIRQQQALSVPNYLATLNHANAINLTGTLADNLDALLAADDAQESGSAANLVRLHLRDLTQLLARLPEGELRTRAAQDSRALRRALFETGDAAALLDLGPARERANDAQLEIFNRFEQIREETTRITLDQQAYIEATGAQLAKLTRIFLWLLTGISVLVVVLGALFRSRILERQLARRLEELMRALVALNEGKLESVTPPAAAPGGGDELDRIARALDTMRLQIIERGRLDEELRLRTREAVENAEAKTQFLSTMSHEVRTPLNAIMGLFELIENADIPERQKLRAHNGRTAAKGLFEVLSNILDASKLEAQMMAVAPGPNPTENLRYHLLATLEGAIANAEKVDVVAGRLVWEPSVPPVLNYDAMRVRQILNNLVDNAVRFTEAGEVVVRCIYEQAEGVLRLSVRDTGIGIKAEDKKHIFDKFRQVDSGPKRMTGGSGLGLSISRALAELMGGALTVDSTPGKGSEFVLQLPAEIV